MDVNDPLRVLIHAPTAGAVKRARSNAANLLSANADAEVRIVVNGDGVAAVLDAPFADIDQYTLVCANTLNRIGRTATDPLRTVPAAVLALVEMQNDGWVYLRA